MSKSISTNETVFTCWVMRCISCTRKVMITFRNLYESDNYIRDNNTFVMVWQTVCSDCSIYARKCGTRNMLAYKISTIDLVTSTYAAIDFIPISVSVPCYDMVTDISMMINMAGSGIIITGLDNIETPSDIRSFCGHATFTMYINKDVNDVESEAESDNDYVIIDD